MKKFVLIFIIILAFALRFWNLSAIPVSLSHDEAAIGYNAWSILNTGRDEYGIEYPVLFRSFDDYKLPGYIYSAFLSERLFGLSEFAVRFPSALLGALTILVLYLLVKQMFGKQKIGYSEQIALCSSFMLAISPWHVNFSRAGFESNGSVFFLILGSFFLFKSLERKYFLILSSICFVATLYFYYTARVVLPFILLTFILLYKDNLIKNLKVVIISLVLGFILLIPLIPQIFTSGLSRVNQVSIFEDKSLTNPYSEAIVNNNNSYLSKIFYNRRIAYMHQFSDNYLKNFAPDYFFVNGTGPMGLLYLWEIPFIIFGFYSLAKTKEKSKWFIFVWFFSVPIVGGLTTGQPNALRTLANAPILALFSGLGIFYVFNLIRSKKYFKFALITFIFIISFFFIRFMFLYFNYYPRLTAANWGDGHRQMAEYVKKNKSMFNKIYITGDFWRPYVYLLFYMNYPPDSYQREGSINGFDNIIFGKASWDKEGIEFSKTDLSKINQPKSLFILSPKDYISQENLIISGKYKYKLEVVEKIDGTLEKEVFYAVELR